MTTAATLVYSATTVTLPHPAEPPTQDPGIADVVNFTVGGNVRVQNLYRNNRWVLTFTAELSTVFDSIRTLWAAATAASALPTFTYTDVFADANAVDVVLVLSEYRRYAAPNLTLCDFTLTLIQADPY